MQDSSSSGFREISPVLIVCNGCGKVHQIHAGNRRPSRCENCGEKFVAAASSGVTSAPSKSAERIHYSITCPDCGTDFTVEAEAGPVIFDCGECGCAFSLEQEVEQSGSGSKVEEPVQAARQHRGKKVVRRGSRKSNSRRDRKDKRRWLASGFTFIIASIACLGLVTYLITKAFEERTLAASESRLDAASGAGGKRGSVVDRGKSKFVVEELFGNEAFTFTRAVSGFASSGSPEDRAAICRFPGETRVRMQKQYSHDLFTPELVNKQEQVGSVWKVRTDAGSVFYEVRYADENAKETVYIAELVSGNAYSFEWEPSVMFTEMVWQDIPRVRPRQSVAALVRIEKSTRYTDKRSPDRYSSYQVYHQSAGDGFVAFVERGSDLDKSLEAVFKEESFPILGVDDPPTTRRVLIEFDFPGAWNQSESPPEARITNLVQRDWVRY